ncbi:T1SS secreted agglutinin RTX [Phage NCTB]|nr:T1SS secreted agglutinin RTX [Phage NCTB]
MKYGSITLLGSATISNFAAENLATDPASPRVGQIWFNTTEEAYKFYDGTTIYPFAKGGDLDNYLLRDGSDAGMTGELVLNSNDQSAASGDRVAVSKGHLDTELATKQDTITGAATTITDSDLTASVALVSDASGKVGESATTAAEIGYVSGVTAPIQTQLDGKQADLGYVPVNKAGDSMTGNLILDGNLVKSLGAPVDANDAVRLVDLDNAISTLNWQDDVLATQIDATLDPGTPSEGDRYILTDVANLHANFGTITDVADGDIVEYVSSEFVVAFDVSDAALSPAGTLAYDIAGSTYMRYNGTAWAAFSGLDGLTAGNGLVKNGNVIDVNMGAGVASLPTDEVGIDLYATSGLFLTVDGSTPSVDTAAQLSLLLDGTTLSTSATGVKVAASGITEVEVAATALGNGLQGGDGTTLSVAAGTGVVVDGTGVNVDETYLDNRYINVDGDTMTGALVLASDPTAAMEATTKQYTDNAVATVQSAVDAAQTRIDNSYFVYDGTGSADASHTVTHNIGVQYVNVTVLDANDEVIMPDSITFDSTTQLTITLSQGLAIRAVCMGAAPQA